FRLDNKWNFFVPPGRFTHIRYIVEDAAGAQHVFAPAEEPSASIAHYVMWRELKYLSEGVPEIPDVRAPIVVALLCAKHAALKPVAITLLQVQELDYTRDAYLQGHHPLDPEFISVTPLAPIKCRPE